jgi:small subunit ribosomal protein S3
VGQKVNPIGMRLGITKTWSGKWFAEKKEYANLLEEDIRLQAHIRKALKHAGISQVEVERAAQKVKVTIHASRPGIIIGRKGEAADQLKDDLVKLTKPRREVTVNIKEVKRPEIDSKLVAENIATQLERRIAFRRAIKRALASAMRLNIQGCKIMVAGRLNGAEMSRTEWVREGRVPLHTLRADIDYGTAEALTTYGLIGVKVWIYRGEDYNQPRPLRRRMPGAGAPGGAPGAGARG